MSHISRWLLIGFGVALLAAATPSIAYAHPMGQAADGFKSGLLHPVFGLDHFLAMLSVGIVSAQLGRERIWTVPGMFVLAMIAGAVPGIKGEIWRFSEAGIASSMIALGAAIATVTEKVRSWPVLLMVAGFGSLHGHAHGIELPKAADPIYYAFGFLTSTVVIHLLGVAIGHLFTNRWPLIVLLRHVGSGIAGMGLMFLKLAAS
ncbi:MAG TPA: HupE/UreJ family protein [Candidatus Angelobacter sp.]|jgi:urease accessory protein|nr:HupE/UreJ family protein [Candidatus Angelobacter sp.]